MNIGDTVKANSGNIKLTEGKEYTILDVDMIFKIQIVKVMNDYREEKWYATTQFSN